MTLFLYITTVLIWGSTWIAIYWQVGDVDVVVSVFYRFAIAAVLFLPLLALLGRLEATTRRDHLFFVLQGWVLFCFNFICFYTATQYMVSGLVSVVFSMVTLFNAINNRLIWGVKPAATVKLGSIVGVVGLVLMLWRDIAANDWSLMTLAGLGLALLGTYCFSMGNMISVRHHKVGLTPMTSNAYAMGYGAATLLLIALLSGQTFSFDPSPYYWGSLLYLAIPGSIIGFTAYLMLVGRMGANKAAYVTVLFPVVALTLSSLFEGYEWGVLSVMGLGFVLLGNLLVLNLIPFFQRRVVTAS